MLTKIRGVRQDDASKTRDWFQDEFFDLFVWTDPAATIVAFQLCYDRARHERVLAWSRDGGFLHRRVDDGEQTPIKNMSPMLVADGRFDSGDITGKFRERAAGLDSAMRDFITAKLAQAETGLHTARRNA